MDATASRYARFDISGVNSDGPAVPSRRGGSGLSQEGLEAVEPSDRSVRLLLRVGAAGEVERRQQEQALARMVEGGDGVVEEELGIGNRSLPRVPVRDRLEEAHRVVREVADGARGERRQLGIGHEALPPHDPLERLERRARAGLRDATALEARLSVLHCPTRGRSRSEKRVAGQRLPTLDAFEQEALRPGGAHAREEHHGREPIRWKDARHRHAGARLRARQEFATLRAAIPHAVSPWRRISITSSGVTPPTPKSSAWRTAWTVNIRRPSTVGHFAARAARIVDVSRPSRRYTQSNTSGRASSRPSGTAEGSSSRQPTGVALTYRSASLAARSLQANESTWKASASRSASASRRAVTTTS